MKEHDATIQCTFFHRVGLRRGDRSDLVFMQVLTFAYVRLTFDGRGWVISGLSIRPSVGSNKLGELKKSGLGHRVPPHASGNSVAIGLPLTSDGKMEQRKARTWSDMLIQLRPGGVWQVFSP